MKQSRLDALADGIFAIAMTLLVIDIKVPHLQEISNASLWQSLSQSWPLFAGYLLSFILLYIYWRGHHYVVSIYAKEIDPTLVNLNGFFLFFIALIPFSAYLLGEYSTTQLAIVIYGIHVAILSILLRWMRSHVISTPQIRSPSVTEENIRHSAIRVILPIYAALLAVILSFFSTKLSLLIFTLSILFNLSSQSSDWAIALIDFFKKKRR